MLFKSVKYYISYIMFIRRCNSTSVKVNFNNKPISLEENLDIITHTRILYLLIRFS